jgi:hypothetical protein
MQLRSKLLCGRCLLVAASALVFSTTRLAQAQTWVNSRQGPALREILMVDATGEPNWIWGREDVAGDGLNAFSNSEQAIDARTAYVTIEANRFYSRVYFSVAGNDPGEVTTYVFLDTDQNSATGGTAAATELDPAFAADPTNGGYEYVIAVQRASDGSTLGSVYQFTNATRRFEIVSAQPNQIATETGQFLDPIRINQDAHGYLQSDVDLNLVNLDQACATDIFVRTTNQTQSLGSGDLIVGRKIPCVPVFTNDIPNVILNPPDQCTSNADCPNNGICINGVCRLAVPCRDDNDCATDQVCTNGRCVYVGGNTCVDNADCNGLVCEQRQCVACTNDALCGRNMVCGPDGRCVNANGGTSTTTSTSTATSTGLAQEHIQGGACACSTVGAQGRGWLGLFGLLGLSMVLGRSINRERNR